MRPSRVLLNSLKNMNNAGGRRPDNTIPLVVGGVAAVGIAWYYMTKDTRPNAYSTTKTPGA
jgi:hypothetical protein